MIKVIVQDLFDQVYKSRRRQSDIGSLAADGIVSKRVAGRAIEREFAEQQKLNSSIRFLRAVKG